MKSQLQKKRNVRFRRERGEGEGGRRGGGREERGREGGEGEGERRGGGREERGRERGEGEGERRGGGREGGKCFDLNIVKIPGLVSESMRQG